jgi:ABC-type sugar transport system substrate-binding protein
MPRTINAIAAAAALAVTGAVASSAVLASEYDDGATVKYYNTFKGKKVDLIVISSGMDIAQGIAASVERQSKDLGFDLQVRDYNWNNDQGAQLISQVISEKPDVLIVQNLDMQAYASLLKRAVKEGIKTIQVQVKATANTDAFVGVDWYQIAYKNMSRIAKACGAGSGKNGKVAILQGTPNNPTNFVGMKAIQDVLKEHPELKVVSDAAADWDASKAHGVAATVLKQNPDLCGYMGLWDGQDAGMAAAVAEADLKGKVFVVSSGSGERSTCNKIADGSYDNYVAYNLPDVTRRLGAAISVALQQTSKAGALPYADYVATTELQPATYKPSQCWTVDEMKQVPWK